MWKRSISKKGIAIPPAIGFVIGSLLSFVALRRQRSDAALLTSDKKIGKGKDHLDAFEPAAAGFVTAKQAKGPKYKLLKFAERRNMAWIGRTLQVQRRYGELHGSNIAAAITLQIFLSLFPLLLVAAAVVGFVASDSPGEVANDLVNSLGLTGEAADAMREAVGQSVEIKGWSSVLGLLTLLWSALGVTSAIQFAYNQAWQSSGRGVKDKAVGLAWLAGAGLLFAASAVITTLLNFLPAGLGIVAIIGSITTSFALWVFTATVLPNVHVAWKTTIPGAIVGVIGLEALKIAAAVWVPQAAASSSAAYGAAGIFLALLAWMLLFGKLVMYSAVANVIRYESLHGTKRAVIEVPAISAEEGADMTRSGTAEG